MKKVLFACAIVLISLNFISCTKVPIYENTELSTGGEEGNGDENPDDN